jgi:hypothetical protein
MRVLLLFLAISLIATDLGVYGPTFPVKEEDPVVFMSQLVEKNEEVLRRVGGGSLRSALQEQVSSPQTFTLAEKGGSQTKKRVLNNLQSEYYQSSSRFVIFDPTDSKQFDWVKLNCNQFAWIVVSGDPVELSFSNDRHVYFDQCGSIVREFHILSFPSIIYRSGAETVVEDVAL